MPWRKYTPKVGKHGPIYHITRGIQVRKDSKRNWVLFIEKNGKRKNKTIGPGRDGLANAIKAAESIAEKFTPIKHLPLSDEALSCKCQFIPFSEDWLDNNRKRWDELTYQRYGEILRLHIWPYDCFKKEIQKISRKEIKMHLREIYKKRSPATVEAVHGVISGIYNEAIDDSLIGANPANGLLKKILPPKNQRDLKDPSPLTIEERDLMLAHAEQICDWGQRLLFKMMVHAGLRLGEAVAVRFKHLNFENGQYTVCESYKLHSFKKPKFGKIRIVDLPVFLVDELREYVAYLKKERLKKGKGAWVDLLFTDPKENDDWPYSQRRVQGLLKKVCKAARLEPRNPHDLRHTYATILLMAHQSPAYVQKQLGHSSISITVDIYGHWVPGLGRGDLDKALIGKSAAEKAEKIVQKPHIFAYPNKKAPVTNRNL